MTTPEGDPWLSKEQAQEWAICSETTIRRAYMLPDKHPGHLKAIKQAGRIKFRRSWVDDWITRTSEPAA